MLDLGHSVGRKVGLCDMEANKHTPTHAHIQYMYDMNCP